MPIGDSGSRHTSEEFVAFLTALVDTKPRGHSFTDPVEAGGQEFASSGDVCILDMLWTPHNAPTFTGHGPTIFRSIGLQCRSPQAWRRMDPHSSDVSTSTQNAHDVTAISQTVRLVYPFRVSDRETSLRALESLRQGDARVWEATEPHPEYLQETLPTTVQFLFGGDRSAPLRGYMHVDRSLAQRWFGNLTAVVLNGDAEGRWQKQGAQAGSRPISTSMHLESDPGIELFISPSGVGALSYCLTLSNLDVPGGLDAVALRDFCYHMSHVKYRVPILRKPHPASDAHLVKPHPNVPSAPAPSAPLDERLGRAGANFTLAELTSLLLGPAKQAQLTPVQDQFLVYSVTRFPVGVRFDGKSDHAYREQALSLAQLEESAHAPPSVDEPGIPLVVLNGHHMVAASTLGVCHLVADQWPLADGRAQGFDAQRVRTLNVKYFLAYLAAVSQRTKLAQFRLEAASLAATMERPGTEGHQAGREQTGDESRALHLKVSRFAASGDLHEVSRREAMNRFFAAVQQSFRVDQNLASLHLILRDIAAADRSDIDGRHLKELADTQRKVEYIEMFIVSFYAFEMIEVLGSNLGFSHAYLAGSTIAAAIGGAASVYLLGIRDHGLFRSRRLTWFAIVGALVLLWLLGGRATTDREAESPRHDAPGGASTEKEPAKEKSAVETPNGASSTRPSAPSAAPPASAATDRPSSSESADTTDRAKERDGGRSAK